MITAAKQIEVICREARAAGMTYGKYVALNPNRFPRPQDMTDHGICRRCGEIFKIPRIKSGALSKKAVHCEACVKKNREEREEARKAALLKYSKEYTVQCTACGRETVTRQAPRAGMNIYCPECRAERRHKSKREDT